MSAATADLLADTGGSGQAGHRCACAAGRGGDESPVHLAAPDARVVRSWPLLVLAAPAAVAVWSGWVGIGQMTGFGQVHPLPGIWDSFHMNTAVTLPIGVEAYAAYAMRAWLSTSGAVSREARRFARWSATGSMLLGMVGQVAYHLLAQVHATHAPWGITTAVSCLPVLVLGMGAALAHLLRADAHNTDRLGRARSAAPDGPAAHSDHSGADQDQAQCAVWRDRLPEADAVASRLTAVGQRISRRTLRAAGLHGSNADLGALALVFKSQLNTSRSSADQP